METRIATDPAASVQREEWRTLQHQPKAVFRRLDHETISCERRVEGNRTFQIR